MGKTKIGRKDMVAKKNSKKETSKKFQTKASSDVKSTISGAKQYFKSTEKKIKKINLNGFLVDAWDMLFHPVRYFTSIKSDGNYEDAILKVLIYGLITAGIKILFNFASITLVGAIFSVILMPIYAILLTFAFAGVMLFFSYLSKGEMNFETAVKAVSSCIFMYPFAYVAYQIAFSYWILFFFSLMIDLYIVFLIYTATTYCLKGEQGVAKVIFSIFTIFVIVYHFSQSGVGYVIQKNPNVGLKYHFHKMQKQMPVVDIK